LIDASGLRREQFLPKKGQALIWAANLLHGGARQIDPTLTRWSQVTHYYFENCIYYTPAYSDEALGQLDVRSITNIATGAIEPSLVLGERYPPTHATPHRRWWQGKDRHQTDLPADFDPEAYLHLNPDVSSARVDPTEHYLVHGAREGRRYRRD
jgi:hypothetical protein